MHREVALARPDQRIYAVVAEANEARVHRPNFHCDYVKEKVAKEPGWDVRIGRRQKAYGFTRTGRSYSNNTSGEAETSCWRWNIAFVRSA